MRKASLAGGVEVTDIELKGGRIAAVLTDKGRIACEMVLLAGGIWGPRLGRKAGIPIPLMPCEHQVRADHCRCRLLRLAAAREGLSPLRRGHPAGDGSRRARPRPGRAAEEVRLHRALRAAGKERESLERGLACMALDDPQSVILGNEPTLAEGRPVGYVTSGAYGYLPAALTLVGSGVEIEYLGRRLKARVASEPLLDPTMARLKA